EKILWRMRASAASRFRCLPFLTRYRSPDENPADARCGASIAFWLEVFFDDGNEFLHPPAIRMLAKRALLAGRGNRGAVLFVFEVVRQQLGAILRRFVSNHFFTRLEYLGKIFFPVSQQ